MKYPATLDKFARFITIGICILFIILICQRIWAIQKLHDPALIAVQGLSVVVMVLIILGCYLFAPQSYLLTDQGLTIKRHIGPVQLNLNEISDIRILNKDEIKGLIRTFGVGGLFGYFGKYYNKTIGKMTFYATNRANAILITTKQGKKIVITPDDPGLIEAVNQWIRKK
jgi:hypothetical protein